MWAVQQPALPPTTDVLVCPWPGLWQINHLNLVMVVLVSPYCTPEGFGGACGVDFFLPDIRMALVSMDNVLELFQGFQGELLSSDQLIRQTDGLLQSAGWFLLLYVP